ncbi:hypothetical protein [Paenibacillus sp. R14(2021)]|uniref:YphA family membrane protein n=1 Tax=Paenibacillus sp. R14(2021) TaxID=2859228 RepID=UPI001C61405A|nr:hypothetical protein [Paenibacillus sp. R14(2021)]
MNDGFVAIWLFLMAAILFFTGWREQVCGSTSARMIGYFLGGIMLLHVVKLEFGNDWVVTGSAGLAVGTALVLLMATRQMGSILFVLFSSLLTGFMWMWMHYIYSMDPVFIVLHPVWDGPILAGLFAGLLADRFRSQFVIAVLGAVMSVSDYYLGQPSHAETLQIGSLAWWDGLVIALTAARLTGNVKGWLKRRAMDWMDNRSGEQGGSS